jgi:hypothetical protein
MTLNKAFIGIAIMGALAAIGLGALRFHYAEEVHGSDGLTQNLVASVSTHTPPATLICTDGDNRTTFIMDIEKSVILSADLSLQVYRLGNWDTPRRLFQNVPFTENEAIITWVWITSDGRDNNYYYLNRNTLQMKLVAERFTPEHMFADDRHYSSGESQCQLLRRQL